MINKMEDNTPLPPLERGMVTPGRYSHVVTAGHKYLIVTGVSSSPLERGQGCIIFHPVKPVLIA